MLRIFEGGLFSIAYDEMKKEIYDFTLRGQRVFLIVPEQQAVTAEKEFISYLPETAPTTFEVTNFTRLANSVFRICGGIASEYSDKGKEALIMWKALTELSPFLKITEGCKEINFGTVDKALSAVSELKNLSLTPDDISGLAENPRIYNESRLCTKLLDISKIMALYNKLLEEKYASAKDDTEKLAKLLTDRSDLFADSHFYVTGFTSFTNPQKKVLAELMKSATLTVHLTLSNLTCDFFEFSEIKQTKEELLSEANKKGVCKSIVRKSSTKQGQNEHLMEAVNLLWRNFGKIDNFNSHDAKSSLKIFEAADPYEASMFIASDIKRQVMAGARYSDFAIIARDSARYSGIIDSYLADANIPCFISKRTSISQYEAIKLIYTAFAAVRSGFSRGDVLTYAKCRLSGIDAEACDEFELYTEKWQIQKDRFCDGIFWNMSPDGYSGGESERNAQILLRIDKTRHTLIDPLIKFAENLNEAKTVREHAKALVDFLRDISLEEKIEKRRIELLSLGEEASAAENGMLWQIICSALDSMVEVLSDTEIKSSDFENQLKVILSEADIGRIPAFSDVVTIASADIARISEKEHIYILGVNSSEFPATAKSNSYFTDKDRHILSELGILNDDGQISYARELFFFSRAMSVAKKSASLLYFSRNEAYAPCEKADVIKRISDITDGAITPVRIADLPILDKIYSPDAAIAHSENSEIRQALIDSGYGREVMISELDISNIAHRLGESVKSIIYKDELYLTQSKIDSYVGCPFAYFLRYDIKLSENERAEFDARNIGTFIHSILENFFLELDSKGKLAHEVSDDEKSDMVKRAAQKFIASVTKDSGVAAKRTAITIDRLYKAALPIVDGLCDELKGCRFIPRFFELRIDGGDSSLPSPATFKSEGGDVHVRGVIDRVDVYNSDGDAYVRVIDYKTGKKTFSPADIDEGKNLQMFLYLKAIIETDNKEFRRSIGVEDGGKIIPAGVIYIKTDMNDITVTNDNEETVRSAIMKKQERRGMILDDEVSISAMNKKYIPVKYKNSGEPDANTKNNLYTHEGWESLNRKICDSVLEISSRMRNGEINATTKKSDTPCEWCKFKTVCRKNTK